MHGCLFTPFRVDSDTVQLESDLYRNNGNDPLGPEAEVPEAEVLELLPLKS